MNHKTRAALAAAVAAVFLTTGCGNGQPAPQPTPTAPVCIEPDGEECDDDPLDLDDLFEKTKTKAPAVKLPVVPTAKKTSGTTTRRR